MRKYFLLSAVALMATSTANATTDYAEVTAKAKIKTALVIDCGNGTTDEMDFGTIIVKANHSGGTVRLGSTSGTGDILAVEDSGGDLICYSGMEQSVVNDLSFPEEVILSGNVSGDELILRPSVKDKVDNMDVHDFILGGYLEIPEGASDDTYTGSFTITYTH
ncbi:MAG: DUF4402 domain-containing protein [Alphaproteobacteria bacterium]|nr:DUF4402 domain-containing protein [Alphaproteobacteria bacterium]